MNTVITIVFLGEINYEFSFTGNQVSSLSWQEIMTWLSWQKILGHCIMLTGTDNLLGRKIIIIIII